jgi:trehalose 6-phosphate phosphatase
LDGHEADVPRFVDGLDRSELERAGIRTEDKGPIVALHWRGAPNEAAAESLAHEIANEAKWKGLIPHRGRKVFEIRPNVAINKGIAVASLITSRPIEAALYGGDDRTDVDAFAALRTLHEGGELRAAVSIAVASDESPPQVSQAADLTVSGPVGFVQVLEALAE